MPKISALASGSTPGGSELVPVVQGGQTVYLTVEQVAARYGVHRPVTGTANEVTITNGDGAAGNPTASLPSSLTFTGKTVTGGTYANIGRISVAYAPAYDLASTVLSVAHFMPLDAASHVIAANKQLNHIRISQTDGGYNQATVGASAIFGGVNVFLQALSGSDATSNTYPAVFSVQNDGPGSAKAVHASAIASGTSSGATITGSFGITPVATSSTGSAAVNAALVSNTGVHDVASGIAITSTGDRLRYGIGNAIAPVPIGIAWLQCWFAPSSSAGARAVQVLDNAGNELGYISKLAVFNGPSVLFNGSSSGTTSLLPAAVASGVLTLPAATDTLVGKATTDILSNKTFVAPVLGDATATTVTASTSLIAASASNGITITQAAITRNHVNGSMTFAAGSAAGNTFAINTGGSSRMSVADAQVAVTPATASTSSVTGSLINAGGLGNAGAIFGGDKIVSTSATAGIGYATGAGGAVTQGTNRTTGVTLDKVSGAITLFSQVNAAVSAATATSFTVTNSAVAATDTVHVCQKSGTDKYMVFVTNVQAGSFQITLFTTGGVTNEAPVINFNVFKGVAA